VTFVFKFQPKLMYLNILELRLLMVQLMLGVIINR